MHPRRHKGTNYLLQIIIICCCILLSGAGEPQQTAFPIPATLKQQLTAQQRHNDLVNWIYTQIQWVTESAAERAPLLKEAAATAWRQPQTPEEQQAWLDLLMNEGHALLLSGNIVYSTDAYREALLWASRHNTLAEDDFVLEYILKPLGNNYTRLGDYEQAQFIQRKALAIALALRNKEAVAATYSNLATTVSSMGRPQESVEYCRAGLQMTDPSRALYGLLLCEQADAWFTLHQVDSAQVAIRKGITILEKNKTRDVSAAYWLLMAYQQAGDMYLAQPATALQFYNKALALQATLLQRNGSIRVRERAKLLYRLGKLYAQQQQYETAAHWLQQCLQLLMPGATFQTITTDDVYGENTLVDLLFTQATVWQAQHHTDEALQLFNTCFAAEKKLRNEYITGASRERSVADSRRRYESAIAAAYAAWQQTQSPAYRQQILQFMESGKAQLLLEEVQWHQYNTGRSSGDSIVNRIQLLERALVYYERNRQEEEIADTTRQVQQKKIEWELADLRKQYRSGLTAANRSDTSDVFNMHTLKTVLPAGQLARSFFAGEQAVYSIEADSAGILFAEKLPLTATGADSIQRFIQQYFQEGPSGMLNHPGKYYQQAYAIYHWLFNSHPLQAGKQYIVLPDGVLNLLPVEALVTAPDSATSVEQWPFVIKQAGISYAYSLQTLQHQYLSLVTGKGFAGFFIAQHGPQQAELAAVVQEKEGIAQVVQQGQWLMNEQATATAFRDALNNKALIHISTHAFAGKDSADAPHIQLYDTPFYLFELKNLQQHPAMVVLSACRTGDGRVITGEGVQSLARSFTAAGTNAVVAGWWNVHDETAAQLVKEFYASLAQQPDAAVALRQSKLHWLQDKNVTYLHKLPYYWAALNYHGQPAPLQQIDWKNTQTISPWWWLIWIPVLLAGTYILFRIRKSAHP